MRGIPIELIFVLIFGIAVLFNIVTQRAARRQQQREVAQDETVQEEIPEEVWRAAAPAAQTVQESAMAPAPWRRAETPAKPQVESLAASPPRSVLRAARQSLFGARWRVQEAFVVATILGRCRADEPHDIR
jgi:hypothetical protein